MNYQNFDESPTIGSLFSQNLADLMSSRKFIVGTSQYFNDTWNKEWIEVSSLIFNDIFQVV